MIYCIFFKKEYYDNRRKYRFYKGVKYMIKDIDNKYYYTIKGVKLPKTYENKTYSVLTLK